MYCRNCGSEIDNKAVICPDCGVQQTLLGISDSGSAGWAVLGFFFPVIGLILYLVWHDTKPLSAKKAGKGALISVIVAVALTIILIILSIVLFSNIGDLISVIVTVALEIILIILFICSTKVSF